AHVARLHATVGKTDVALGQAALIGVAGRRGVGVGVVPVIIVAVAAVVITTVIGAIVMAAAVVAPVVITIGRRDIGPLIAVVGVAAVAAVAGGRAVAHARADRGAQNAAQGAALGTAAARGHLGTGDGADGGAQNAAGRGALTLIADARIVIGPLTVPAVAVTIGGRIVVAIALGRGDARQGDGRGAGQGGDGGGRGFFRDESDHRSFPSTEAAPERIRSPSVAAIDRAAKLNGF